MYWFLLLQLSTYIFLNINNLKLIDLHFFIIRSIHIFIYIYIYINIYDTDAPICKPEQKWVYASAKNEMIEVSCEMLADPGELSFKWYTNSSLSSASLDTYTANGTKSAATYIVKDRYSYGHLFCFAENDIGPAVAPCIYNVIPAGTVSYIIFWNFAFQWIPRFKRRILCTGSCYYPRGEWVKKTTTSGP